MDKYRTKFSSRVEVSERKSHRQSKNGNGEPIGSYDINPFLNTTIYDVEFPDGEIRE